MSQMFPYDENKFGKNVKLEDILKTPGDSDIGYFVEVDLIYPDKIKEKSKHFPFAAENQKINPDHFTTYMIKTNQILTLKQQNYYAIGLITKIISL